MFVFVVVALDEVRLPAASLGIGVAPALDADELGGRHRTRSCREALPPESGRMGQFRRAMRSHDRRGTRSVERPDRENMCS